MKRSEPLHLLIADPSENSAEEMVTDLRNAGYATRAHHVDSLEELDAALGRQRWDLLLCRADEAAQYEPEELIARLRQQELDVPVILMEASNEVATLTAGMQMGAVDVLLADEEDRFLLVLKREIGNLQERRKRRHAEVAMQESERRNQLLLDTSTAAIAYVHEGMHIYANRAYLAMFDYASMDDLAGVPLLDMIDSADQGDFKAKLKEFASADEMEPFEVRGVASSGDKITGTATLSNAQYDGEACMQVLIRKPESSGTIDSKQLEQLRAQDPLTGLMSRPAFFDRLEKQVGESRQGSKNAALLMVDLDGFSKVMDEVGVTGGDDVLKQVAQHVKGVAPDNAISAYLGEDVFCVVAQDTNVDAAKELAEKIRHDVEETFWQAGNKTVRLTTSIGICLLGNRTENGQEAFAQVRRATDHVRELSKQGNSVYLFDPADFVTARDSKGAEDDQRAREILRLLAHGMKENTLVLLFQPIISLRGDAKAHYEVYLRLPDAEGKLLTPDDFIYLAEQAGMGGKIDRWVVLQAIKRLSAQREKGEETHMTINLTHAALTDEEFLPWLKVALNAAKLPKESVILQFTEMAATTYLKQAKAFTEALTDMDAIASLSHFGGSVNPFGTLRHLQVNYVKVDGSFMEDLAGNSERQEALREMISTLEEQSKITVVPMVSNANVLASLFTSGANFVQGHYLQEPSQQMDYDFTSDM